MKSALFAAALLAGSAALAQDPETAIAVPDPVTIAVPDDRRGPNRHDRADATSRPPTGQVVAAEQRRPGARRARHRGHLRPGRSRRRASTSVPGTNAAIGGPLVDPTDAAGDRSRRPRTIRPARAPSPTIACRPTSASRSAELRLAPGFPPAR